MTLALYILAAVCGYLVAGFNPAIAISIGIYRKDIRECGSGNPGFTNFRRTFGGKWAWCVLVIDLAKAAAVVALFAWLLSRFGESFQLGAAFTGAFCMLGHAFPLQYNFKGGKGFLVCLSTMYVIDWRVGLFATVLMIVLLLLTKYMSFSTVAAMWTCPVALAILEAPLLVIIISIFCVAFMTVRHKENFKRLINGTEAKFTLKKK